MNLIILFNGWGMDENIANNLIRPKNYKLKIINYPYDTQNLDLSKYDDIIYLGWSFGCHYLTKFIMSNKIKSNKIVALNGHSQIIGKFGINPKMFDLTYNTLNPENLLKFYKNMNIRDDFIIPEREFSLVKNELLFFKENYKPLDNIFNLAILGKNDKIIPYFKQKKYFEKNNVKIIEMDAGHFIFDDKNLLKNIVSEVKN